MPACFIRKGKKTTLHLTGRNSARAKTTGCSPNATISFSAHWFHFLKFLYFASTYGSGFKLKLKITVLGDQAAAVVFELFSFC